MSCARLPNFVEYDSLIGPRQHALDHRRVAANCHCQD